MEEQEKKQEEEKMPEETAESKEEKTLEEPVAKVEEKAEEEEEPVTEVEEKVEEPVAEVEEKIKEQPKEELKQEDEYMAMMKEDEEEKKAEQEAKEDEPEEEKDIGEELSLIKKKKIKGKRTKKQIKEEQKAEEKVEKEIKEEKEVEEETGEPKIYALRTTANREDQVMDFVSSNAARKKLEVYSIIRPHGMRGYIFLEAGSRSDAEQAAFGVPYARGLLPNIIQYSEIEHMLEQVKKEVNIQKNDIAEIISGPFKREKCKITRIDRTKEEVVVELLEAAVPIPITVKMDAVRVIRRESDEDEN